MGGMHLQVERLTLAAAVARARWIAHVRRAEPPSALRSDGTELHRWHVVECLKADPGRIDRRWTLPPLVEVAAADAIAQRQLAENPYSHPVQQCYALTDAPAVANPTEAIFFFDVQWLGEVPTPLIDYAFGGLCVPLTSRDAVVALIPPAPPLPAPRRSWWRRLFGG